jgi:flagellar protein FliO/FliZ
MRLHTLLFSFALAAAPLKAQNAPASPTLMTLGPIDGESDQKSSVITLRYDSKPGFQKPLVEAHGSFLQIVLPNTLVLKPGVFQDANSPYIRKFAPFQLDEDTAALRLFVTKEAENLAPAVSVDILENRVLIIVDHEKAEKAIGPAFNGVPVRGGPSPEEVVKQVAVRSDIPDPISLMANPKTLEPSAPDRAPLPSPALLGEAAVAQSAPGSASALRTPLATPMKAEAQAAGSEASPPRWADSIETKLIAVAIFCALMIGLLIALKSWRRVATKALPPGADFSLRTLASHALGPKQKITVIQVGQEQILLGVSPEGISFLTSLRPQTENPSMGRMPLDPSLYQKTLSPSPKRAPLREAEEALPRPSTISRSANRQTRDMEPRTSGAEPGSSIRYGVGDEGIKNLKSKTASAPSANDESLEDVTRLIRKKLKDLPKV